MEFNKRKAIYSQIYDLICEKILLDNYSEDQRIDSVREMAVSLEVNPNTVMRAYGFLQDEGIIFNKRGIGYFISIGAKDLVLSIKKNSFEKEELPQVFRESMIYDITPDYLKELYVSYLEGAKNEEK